MTTKKYTKCSFDGCRKKALKDGLCTKHAGHVEPTNVYPIDNVMRVTELEAARFAASDAEIRNAQQGMKILELEITAADRALADAVARTKFEQDRRRANHEALKQLVETKKKSYLEFVTELSQKYNLDPQQMAIDPDTRVLRDLREGTKS